MEHRAPSGKGRSRGKGGMSEPSPDLATTCRESAPAATLHLLPRGGEAATQQQNHNPRAGSWPPAPEPAATKPQSPSRHRGGRGEWPSNTRTGRHARGLGGGGEPPMPDPTTVALLPPSNAEHTSPPRHPIPTRPTATRGVDDGPLPPSSVTPRVVPVVDFGGNAM
jgi:hypothetical protein